MNKIYWLRGGIFISVLYGVVSLALIPFSEPLPNSQLWFSPTLLVLNPIEIFLYLYDVNLDIGRVLHANPIVTAVFIYFIVGAILGWLYGKIKNRNKIN